MIEKIISWVLFIYLVLCGVYLVAVVIWINARRDQLRKEMKRMGCGND